MQFLLYIFTVALAFGQHLAIVATGGEPIGVKSADTAGWNLLQMLSTTDDVPNDAENDSECVYSFVTLLDSIIFLHLKIVGGICFEVNEIAGPYLTMPKSQVQESGWE